MYGSKKCGGSKLIPHPPEKHRGSQREQGKGENHKLKIKKQRSQQTADSRLNYKEHELNCIYITESSVRDKDTEKRKAKGGKLRNKREG